MRRSDATKILDNIHDLKQRSVVANILDAKFTHNIRCLSKKCKGRIIGHLDTKGKVIPTTDNKGRMFMRASRNRLDGFFGFECGCGNDSRIAEAERGVPGFINALPTKENIERVWGRLKVKPAVFIEHNGKQEIDKFLIEKI